MTADLHNQGPLHTTLVVERDHPLLALAPPPFDGYPYLVQRVGQCALRHLAILPANWPRARLLHLARRQAEANQFETRLCLGPTDVVCIGLNGSVTLSDFVPTGLPVLERLVLADPVPDTKEVAARRATLRDYAKRLHAGTGYLVGDGLEGGRPAAPGEATRLTRCASCGMNAGEFLALQGEGNLDMTPRILQVHCKCENHNRCAGCGEPLAERRLSSYGYDERKSSVTYYAAYLGFGHRCT